MTTSYETIQIRRGLSQDFNEVNPVLASGEPAFTLDDSVFKIGNGQDPWSELASIGGNTNNDNRIISYSVSLNASPAISSHSTYTLVVDAPDITISKLYSILVSPSRELQNGTVIAYAYVSNDSEISIKITNASSIDIPFENNPLVINICAIFMGENSEVIFGPTIVDASVTTTTTISPVTTTTTSATTTTSGPTTTSTTTTSIPGRAITFAAYGRRILSYSHPLYNSSSILDVGTVNVGTSSNSSYYGTYDQDGNIYELVEDAYLDSDFPDSLGSTRFSIGGDIFLLSDGFRRCYDRCGGTGVSAVYFNEEPISQETLRPINNTYNLETYKNTIIGSDLNYGLRLVRNTAPPSNELSSWAYVGNANNSADTFKKYSGCCDSPREFPSEIYFEDANFGSVAYSYWIKKVPIKYSEFLTYINTVDSQGLQYNNLKYCIIGMFKSGANLTVPEAVYGNYLLFDNSRSNGNKYYVNSYNLNKPVASLNWIHAARYCNWLHTSGSSTESGAYDLSQNESPSHFITRENAEIAAIPTVDEWYKAAYYNPVTSTYYRFATQSNRMPQICGSNIATGNGIIDFTQNSLYIHYPE